MPFLLIIAFFVPSAIAIFRHDRNRTFIVGLNVLILLLEWGFLASYYGFALASAPHDVIKLFAHDLAASGSWFHAGSVMVLLGFHLAFQAIEGLTGGLTILVWMALVFWAVFGQTLQWQEEL